MIWYNKKNLKILVFRNGDIGNTLMAIPFFKILKELFPLCTIHVVLDKIGIEILKNDPFIDKLIYFNRKKEGLKKQINLVKEWNKEKYDVSFHLRAGVRNELMAKLSGVRERIGFPLKGSVQFLTKIIYKSPGLHHYKNGSLILKEFISGVPDYLPKLEIDSTQNIRVEKLLGEKLLYPGKYFVIHPAGKTIKKGNWQLEFFKNSIKEVIKIHKLPCIIIGTSNDGEELSSEFMELNNVTMWFQNDIAETFELIRRAKFFIGNDSGPFHIAECYDVPSIALYRDNPVNFKKWHPLNDKTTIALFHNELKDELKVFAKINQFICNLN